MNHARLFINGSVTGDGGGGDNAGGGGYEVLTFKFATKREIDQKGMAASKSGPLVLEMEIYAFEGKSILLGMYVDMFQQVSGRIEFHRTDPSGMEDKTFRKLKFEKAYVVGYEENFSNSASRQMKLKLVISAGKVGEESASISHDWAS
jgi:hypothetical protein